MQNTQKDTPANNYYSKADFWDQRYQAGGYFDWYAEFPQLQYAFQTQYGMTKDDHILMVGCGNSKVSEQMYEVGYKNIVNIDISPTVIQQMKVLSPGMEWLVMDATQMTFKDKKFDYVIDKGTMDALIAGRDLTPAIKLLKQCMRVTKQQGQLIQITYGSPEGRKKVFQDSLPFSLFDYYFAYVNLNDMSTMINLMRNNLIGQNGQSVEKQMALQKSMKQFMMIKLLRAKRSKQKQFVIWQNYSKTVQPVVTQKVDKGTTQQQKQITSQQKVPQKSQISESISQQTIKPIAENKQQVNERRQSDNIKYQSKPQKQSYVYAYSIKRKFGYDFALQQLSHRQVTKSFESNEHSHFQIKGQSHINQSIIKCNKYCDNKQISYGKINYIQQNKQFSTNNQSIKITLQNGQNITINILTKTNIDLKINFIDLKDVSQLLTKLSNYLINKMGLSFHPCPKTYSLFTVMKSRMKAKSVNQILNKYWYPTYSFSSIDIQKGQASVIISIPPVLPQLLKQVLQHIQNHLSSSKQIKVAIQASRNGFISFPQLKLLGILNLVSLSHNAGKSLNVEMIDFWIGNNQQNSSKQDSKLFIVENNRLQVSSKLLPLTLLHLMALY